MQSIEIPLADDFHCHLRQDALMKAVVPTVKQGGSGLAYVMPNLKPPVTSTNQALEYKKSLEALDSDIDYLMTLYLSPELTPDEVKRAAKAGIAGVKSYPRGVTTNSEAGIESYEVYYPIFEAMQEVGMVLNLHGEVPSDHENGITILNAEEKFLQHLIKLHKQFPKLKIVLEHATSKAAVDCVLSLGDTVGCSITVHHIDLIVDDWAGKCHNFCKPVAKFPHDREAIRDVIKQDKCGNLYEFPKQIREDIFIATTVSEKKLTPIGHPRFFLGTDSAPHPRKLKESSQSNAGVFTQPYVLQYLADTLESFGALDKLQGFACENGRKFYAGTSGMTSLKPRKTVKLVKKPFVVPREIPFVDDEGNAQSLVPFKAGQTLAWSLEL